MSDKGLSSEDLRRRASVSTLRRNSSPNGHEDPIDKALSDSRKITAERILRRTEAEMDTEAIKAETARIQAQIELGKQQTLSQQPDADNQLLTYLSGKLDETQAQMADIRQELADRERQALEARMDMLQGEITRLRQERTEAPDPVTHITEEVEKARALVQLVTPPPLATMAGTPDDAAFRAWEVRAQNEHELRKMEYEERSQDRLEERRDRLEIQKKELELKDRHYQRIDRFMTDTAPKLLDLGKEVLDILRERRPTPAAGSTAMGQGIPPTPLGASAMTCEQCQGIIYYREGWAGVFCPTCGAEYRFTPAPEEPMTAPIEEAAS